MNISWAKYACHSLKHISCVIVGNIWQHILCKPLFAFSFCHIFILIRLQRELMLEYQLFFILSLIDSVKTNFFFNFFFGSTVNSGLKERNENQPLLSTCCSRCFMYLILFHYHSSNSKLHICSHFSNSETGS